MSVCTWATVVSTVPSQSVNGAENVSPLQIFGNINSSGEPIPLPTFLSFLELLEEGNGEENDCTCADDKLSCPEDLNDTPLMSDGNYNLNDFEVFDLERSADCLLMDGTNSTVVHGEGPCLFDCAAADVVSGLENGACRSTQSDWIPEGLFSLSSSNYSVAEAYDNLNKQSANFEVVKPIVIEKGLYDWSSDLFDQSTTVEERATGAEAPERQNDASLTFCKQRNRRAFESPDLLEASSRPHTSARRRSKRKRVSDLQHGEPQSPNYLGTKCRKKLLQASTTKIIGEPCI